MLQSIRDRSQSWGAKILVGAVVATLALFGIESLVGLLGGGGDKVATVNGEPITRQQLELEVQRAIRSGQVPPEQERVLRGEILDSLISERLLTDYADAGGLHLSEEQIDQLIVVLPEFHDAEGRFSSELFRNRLASAGFTPSSFRQALRQDMKRQQLQQGLVLSDFALESEQERLAALQRQTRSFRYHLLGADDLPNPIEVSEAELEAYYADHSETYRRPEQVRLRYVILDRQQMAEALEVSDADIRAAWEARGRDADRRISHIMVSVDDERSVSAARERLDEVRERLAQGEAFADLAREYSDDTASAEQGGDLGFISRGFFGDDFDDAAFGIDRGQVSDIVETSSGLHLIQVTELDLPPLAEMRDELAREVALQQVDSAFNERVQALIDESFAAEDLASVAQRLDLTLQESDWVSRETAEGVLAEPGVMRAAFSSEVLKDGFNSEVIELDADRRLVLRVSEHREATVRPLAEVRDAVMRAVQSRKQREALLEVAAERVAQLRDGSAGDAEQWQRLDGVTRQSEAAPAFIVDTAFALPQPQGDAPVYGQASSGEQVALIALDQVTTGEPDAQTEAFVARLVEQLRGQAAVQALYDHLRDTADIERH